MSEHLTWCGSNAELLLQVGSPLVKMADSPGPPSPSREVSSSYIVLCIAAV